LSFLSFLSVLSSVPSSVLSLENIGVKGALLVMTRDCTSLQDLVFCG
jgi:hypothetical protein